MKAPSMPEVKQDITMLLNVENYLARISFQDEPQININTLAKIHRKHIQSIPFENLDISYGRRISLDMEKIEEKIVLNRRGGFCYELNGLFYCLLDQLGFDVEMISARVHADDKYGREFDHMLLAVNLGKEWLVDVGFGDNFLEPIQFKLCQRQKDTAGYFRIIEHDSEYYRLEFSKDGVKFMPRYIFTQTERQLDDYEKMCEYHQTSSESSFTRERLCTISTTGGRVTLRDENLIETVDGIKTVKKITNKEEYFKILSDRFGIEIGDYSRSTCQKV
jgi:N-hydroxyarylamine O-acetyltransferase